MLIRWNLIIYKLKIKNNWFSLKWLRFNKKNWLNNGNSNEEFQSRLDFFLYKFFRRICIFFYL